MLRFYGMVSDQMNENLHWSPMPMAKTVRACAIYLSVIH